MTTGAFIYEWAIPYSRDDSDSHIETGEAGTFGPPLRGHPTLSARETEIYLPARLSAGRKLAVEGLLPDDAYFHDAARQTLYILPAPSHMTPGTVYRISVKLDPAPHLFVVNDLWSDFSGYITALIALLLALAAYVLAT
jgi:Glycoside hydrolase family 5 C-terminal domain